MDFIKNQIARIQQLFEGLSTSQKMLAATLVIIMVMTIWWWAAYAGRAELEPLLNQSLSAEEVSLITSRLRGQGIPYRMVGDRIHVPADRRLEVLADLGYAQMLPRDTRSAFDEIISRASPFISSRQQEELFNQAKQTTLAQIIRRFPKVGHAVVIIDPRRERGPNGVEPSATVNITMRAGEPPDMRLVNAAADLVAGAVANLPRNRIRVIIDGVSYPVRGREDASPAAGSDEYLAQVQKAERYYSEKLARQFSFIDGAMISVTVKVNNERTDKVKTEVDPKNLVHKPVSEETSTDETRSSARPSGEPGVVTNAGMSVAETGTAETSSGTTEKTRTDYVVQVGRTDIKTFNPGGDVTVTAASVLLPRSHFVQVYKKRTNTTAEPEPQAINDFIRTELAQVIRPGVRACLGVLSDDAIHVDTYTDLMPPAAAVPAAASTSMTLLLGDHVKEIALGVLAVFSLLLVAHMVRKSSPAPPAAPPPTAPKAPATLHAGEEAVGEATEGAPMLDAMEVDEDSAKVQQMLAQVSQLVEENPDSAASLVKRWLNR